jgi:single-strand DNA-binding protein
MTTLTITGHLASDPELRFTPNGKAVATFTVISSKSVKKPDGTWENTDVTPWTVKCWNKTAENIADSLRKGMGVIFQGSATWASWDDKTTGQKRGKMEVTAFNVGIDLKRHTVAVTNQSRNAEGDVVEDVWSAPTWKTEPTVPAGFDEMPPF